MHTIRQVIYNDIDLEMMNKAIHWAETAIPNRYTWEELYDSWNYPFEYLFRFWFWKPKIQNSPPKGMKELFERF